MQILDNKLVLSATDLANHLGCSHLTQLARSAAEREIDPPRYKDDLLAVLEKRGLEHETAYVAHLESIGRTVVSLRDFDGDAARKTVAAMREGSDVIVQADLSDGKWRGRADFLVRVETPSALGEWSYEVVDTKLAQETRGGTILQLCLYTELVGELQGLVPENMYVVRPGTNFEPDAYRFAEYRAYYALVREDMRRDLPDDPAVSRPETYPDPVPHCDICKWWSRCEKRRRDDDHLSYVAGIHRSHVEELREQGTGTLAEWAGSEQALWRAPRRGLTRTFERLHRQAQLQDEGRRTKKPVHELLPLEEGRGLLRLPEPSRSDVFLDFEGDGFVEGGGLEYLFGYAYGNDAGELEYEHVWATDFEAERAAFERFLAFVMKRWKGGGGGAGDNAPGDPGFHIYHFAPYEPVALKRMAGKYGGGGDALDRLLRGERLIDLHRVVREGVRASVERYSLKDLEPFFGYSRDLALRDASIAKHRLEHELEMGTPEAILEEDRDLVIRYNRDDCLATAGLRDWLEDRRADWKGRGEAMPRPELQSGDPGDRVEEAEDEAGRVALGLLATLPEERDDWTETERRMHLLAHLVPYFQREEKCAWWDFFRLHELTEEEALAERKAIMGLMFEREIERTKRGIPTQRYTYPDQEIALDDRDRLVEVLGEKIGVIDSIDPRTGTVDIRKRGAAADRHPYMVHAEGVVKPGDLHRSLLSFAQSLLPAGDGAPDAVARDLLTVMAGSKPLTPRDRDARLDLLFRRPPQAEDAAPTLFATLRQPDESAAEAALRITRGLDRSILPVQGPPGTGKTYVGGEMIARLAASGARVGVTAVSHKVILHLLRSALERADGLEIALQASHKWGDPPAENERIGSVDNKSFLAALHEGQVVGGTAWLWSREDARASLDVLFIDEAGQLSLAMALAASRAAKNVVLLGDPQQLQQPQRGAHPEGADVSALEHLLDGAKVIDDDRGLLLDRTWRLHPAICRFTSELFYENRLEPIDKMKNQRLVTDSAFKESGLYFVPVSHQGNQSSAPEEAEAVAALVSSLLAKTRTWIDADGIERKFASKEILVVAPYNAQVGRLRRLIPDVRIGTVDKFQGQEAPVVIYSMTSSSAEDAPRGMSFLYDPHRFNVAVSRARCVSIVVAAPALLRPDCRTPHQMRMANVLCRYHEMATEVRVPGKGRA
ncbi:MAG: TM0106 family RecB-like putative nuclease [Gemmatimonadetes bacterium]|nr:TM0106 family RecB-like putative nuclease [Gemmatimonadota bacterium]